MSDDLGAAAPVAGSVDQEDLQGNILCGYGNAFSQALYAFVHVDDGAAGRRLLGELAERVTNALPWRRSKPSDTLNVALTHPGLAALGVPERVLATFPEEFRVGMAARAHLLGDRGASAPERWDPGLRAGEQHLLVTIAAQDPDVLERRRDALLERLREPGVSLTRAVDAALLDHPAEGQFGREHFGFADGVAQPTIVDPRGSAGPGRSPGKGAPARFGRWDDIEPGEFVLDYRDEDGIPAPSPDAPVGPGGSYMVVRKLRQHVALFNAFMRRAAGEDPHAQHALAAKVVGRWRDGTPLALSPDRPDPELIPGGSRAELVNDFRYRDDPDGLRCPVGAHIRRANPRDALGWRGLLTRRHRIIRRGMPYGPSPTDPAVDDGVDRGLVFVCYQASIERQFELIQGQWLDDGDVFGLGPDKDFLLAEETGEGKMTILERDAPPRFLYPQPSFVTTTGGDYYFAPGIAALKAIAAGLYDGGER